MSERTAVVAGIGSLEADGAVLDWAADAAWRAGEQLYLVHCYRRLVSTDRYWPPLMHVNDVRRDTAAHVVSSAAQHAHARHPDLAVDGSSVPGSACGALIDLSHVAGLLVVGRHASTPTSAVCAIAESAACPVVFVGSQPSAAGPVVLYLDGDDLVVPAVEFAFAEAAGAGAELLVVRSEPEPSVPDAGYELAELTERQEQLDEALSGWHERYPHVAVTVELRAEPPVATVNWAVGAGRLLVLSRRSVATAAELDARAGRCPVAVVPPHPLHARGYAHAGVDG